MLNSATMINCPSRGAKAMNYLSKLARLSQMVLAIVLSVLLVTNVHAVECKGRSQSACDSSSSCSWVKGYKRSDGAKVSSFCRAKSGKGTSSSQKKTSKKVTDKKADKKTSTKKKVTDSTKTKKKDAKSSKKSKDSTKKKADKSKKSKSDKKKKAKKTDKKKKVSKKKDKEKS